MQISWQAQYFLHLGVCLRGRGSIWLLSKGMDVVERAARGLNLRDRRSTLEMAHRFRGRRSIFCIWVCVCMAGATCGSCLEGLDVVERAAWGLNLRDRRSTLGLANFVAGAVFSASGCVFAWQGQHVAAVYRG